MWTECSIAGVVLTVGDIIYSVWRWMCLMGGALENTNESPWSGALDENTLGVRN